MNTINKISPEKLNEILNNIKEVYGTYNDELCAEFHIGIGYDKFTNNYCIVNIANNNQVIHHATKEEAELLIDTLNKMTH